MPTVQLKVVTMPISCGILNRWKVNCPRSFKEVSKDGLPTQFFEFELENISATPRTKNWWKRKSYLGNARLLWGHKSSSVC